MPKKLFPGTLKHFDSQIFSGFVLQLKWNTFDEGGKPENVHGGLECFHGHEEVEGLEELVFVAPTPVFSLRLH